MRDLTVTDWNNLILTGTSCAAKANQSSTKQETRIKLGSRFTLPPYKITYELPGPRLACIPWLMKEARPLERGGLMR